MVEFRTEPPKSEKKDESDGGSDTLDSLLNTYIEGVKEDPELKLQLLSMAEDNGLNPALLQPLVDLDKEEIQQLQQAQAQRQMEANNQQNNQQNQQAQQLPSKDKMEEVTPQDLSEFLDELMEYKEPDTTIEELQEFVDENPQMTQTAIDLKL